MTPSTSDSGTYSATVTISDGANTAVTSTFSITLVNLPPAFATPPVTQSISCHSSVFKQMGIGGSIFNDVAGPSRRTGFNFSSAYHLRLDNSKNQMLGVGFV